MRERLLRLGLAACLLVPVAGAVACDKEDQRDVEEGVNDADREIDKLDSDGKDD